MRNVATDVDKAITEWADRLAKLRESPRGNNYDFSGRQLTGVVVFPSPPWSPQASAMAELVPGLHAAVSAAELNDWINRR